MRCSFLFLPLLLAPMMLAQGDFLPEGPVTLQARSATVPPSLFGVIQNNLPWGASWTPFPFYGSIIWAGWSRIEPHPGVVDYSKLDSQVPAGTINRDHVIVVLGYVPSWAFCNPQAAVEGGPSEPPCNLDAWRNYVRGVVRHFHNSGIEAYEPWNEPNSPTFFHGSVASLVEMNRIAYEVIKQEQPSAIVLTSGIGAYESSWAFLEDYAKAGGLNYADILAEHFYVAPKPPEAMLRKIRIVQQIVGRYKPGMPIWNTETGWRIHNHDRNDEPEKAESWSGRALTDRESVAYVGRSYLLTWAAGVDRLYWYSWGNTTMALSEYDGKTPKAAARAYEMIEEWMIGHRITSCSRTANGVWTCYLQQGNIRTLVAWTENGDVQFTVPANFHEAEELAGQRVTIHDRNYHLDIVPVRFSEK